MQHQPTVFISYSWDNVLHKRWVRSLADRLQEARVAVILDQLVLHPGDSVPAFIENAVRDSDFVLLVATPNYRARANSDRGGVGYEGSVITGEIYQTRNRRKFIPLLRHGDPASALPTWCMGSLWIDFRDDMRFDKQVQELVHSLRGTSELGIEGWTDTPTDVAAATTGLDWTLFLERVEADRYEEIEGYHTRFGWSQSYSELHLPLVFPGREVPQFVSPKDSVTETNWMIRGLLSLRRLVQNNVASDRGNLTHINRLLAEADQYLSHHWDHETGASGVYRDSHGGPRLHPDVRHTTTWLKAKLALGTISIPAAHAAISFVMKHLDISDRRLYTYAEVGSLVSLLRTQPGLRPADVSVRQLRTITKELERVFLDPAHSMRVVTTGELLFVQPGEEHLAPYMTWWALDAAGDLLSRSSNPAVRDIRASAVRGLQALKITLPGDKAGFPMLLSDASPDPLTTAHMLDVLMRTSHSSRQEMGACLRYVFASMRLSATYTRPYLLWSVPVAAETAMKEYGPNFPI